MNAIQHLKLDPATPLLGIYPTEMLTYVQKGVCVRNFTVAC